MSNYVVEYKVKAESGFTHVRKVTDEAGVRAQSAALVDVTGLEFFTVRLVKPKPEPKPKEVKK
jgi:hypothetical protein